MLSDVGWLNVISIMGILIFGCSFGLYFMYQGRKTNVKLLFYMGLAIFFNGLWYWGNFWESLSLLITGKNFDIVNGIDIPYELQAIMSYIWVPFSIIFTIYVGGELLIPKRKWYIVGFILFLSIVWELLLFLDPLGSVSIYVPDEPGEDLVDEDMLANSLFYLIGLLYVATSFIFLGIGYLIKSIKSTDVLRKKYFYLSIGFILNSVFSLIEGSGIIGVGLFLVRIGMVFTFWLYYLGLKEEPIKVEKISTEKEVKIEDSLFRIAKRPSQITEEEVTYYREQKICLVCKSKVGGFNTYICTGCDALYCENCARALSNLENACWACNAPIDKSRPSKPFKIEGTEAEVKDKIKKPKS
ncbi:MAG: hypothetical protein ACFFAQ_09030 [Promethearchaeota archaeon]